MCGTSYPPRLSTLPYHIQAVLAVGIAPSLSYCQTGFISNNRETHGCGSDFCLGCRGVIQYWRQSNHQGSLYLSPGQGLLYTKSRHEDSSAGMISASGGINYGISN